MKVYCEFCNKVVDENAGERVEHCPHCGEYNSCFEGEAPAEEKPTEGESTEADSKLIGEDDLPF